MTLLAALATAKPGDVITLADPEGDVSLKGLKFSPPVTIQGGTFRSLTMIGCTGLHFTGTTVQFTPNAATASNSKAVTISGCQDIAFTGGKVLGGRAVNGANGNVLDLWCANGVSIEGKSNNITLADNEIAGFDRLVGIGGTFISILRNDLHTRRRTAIVGGDCSDVLIDGNDISDAQPWRMGMTPMGDHADCLALWSGSASVTPNERVVISNNRMTQLGGSLPLGMWLQGTAAAPFIAPQIVGNLIIVPSNQAIMTKHTHGGLIERNTLLMADVAGGSAKQRPSVVLLVGTKGVTVRRNITSTPVGIDTTTVGAADNIIEASNVLAAGSVSAGKVVAGAVVAA